MRTHPRTRTLLTLLGIKPSPQLWGRARASLRSLSAHRPRRLRVSPRHDSATHFTLLSQLQRFRRPSSRGRLLPRHSPARRAADPHAPRDPESVPTPWDATPLEPPSPPLSPGCRGHAYKAVSSFAFHTTKLTSPLNIAAHPSAWLPAKSAT